MCGRYMLDKDFDDLLRRYNINIMENNYVSSKEIFPSQKSTIIINDNNEKILQNLRWGFKGFYGKKLIINARSETALEKKLFKNSFIKRRCIVPANGFFEWENLNNKKVKRRVGLIDNSIFSIGGIFRTFLDDEGIEFNAFTILTTSPSEQLGTIHNRMPVIIDRSNEDIWLDTNTHINTIRALCETNHRTFHIV